MSVTSNIDALLSQDTSIAPKGRSVDLVLPKSAGQIRRSRDYRVYLPAGYDGQTAMPMVMALHGCKQSHLEIQVVAGLDRIADREGFIVVYPSITSHTAFRSRNCWGWWMHRQRIRGSGEVGDLLQIVSAVSRDYAIDQDRLHVCGLSAGAAMSVVALANYSDVWKSGASVAGLAFGESARAVKYAKFVPVKYKPIMMLNRLLKRALVCEAPDLLIIQSAADKQVDLKASEILAQTWRTATSLSDEPTETASGKTQNTPWRYAQYADNEGRVRLGYFTVEGIKHGWIGGNAGKYSTTEGPNVSELICAFFSASQQALSPVESYCRPLVAQEQHLSVLR
ncbi:alpha/beta hydrolase family esterase [Granulosicoccus antarcticus]|uniref:extracellular catalytic domain type 1 short-chain-length polyhydroxyalkanoate depolymerase n=1 Tax=Granulosicoccus antarcticus TaxID=437505 RepID=UPI0012FE46E8|nr:PHB depolymerase family esterase [Granulosicoccus antarcticus]